MPAHATRPIAVVTGASSGLGFAIARQFLAEGYVVVGVAREKAKLEQSAADLAPSARSSDSSSRFIAMAADVGDASSVTVLFKTIGAQFGQINVLINCVGQSDRGAVESLKPERLNELIHTNVVTTLLCSQAALPWLEATRGSIVNIGSLASKVGARHLGAYPAAKHALAGLTQQMRLEWRERGVHVALLCPGPIRRDDAGERYKSLASAADVPEAAMRPGGGTALKGLAPEWVAKQVLCCVKRRTPEMILPSYTRLLIGLGNLLPRLGDWILLKMTNKSN